MKLFIPAVGYRIRLTQDWTFDLYAEHRNKTMFEAQNIKIDDYWGGWREPMKRVAVTVPTGTVLEVDRVYVRTMSKSATTKDDDYDSVSFKVTGAKSRTRFWAKLEDVNRIEYELPPDVIASKEQARAKALAPKKLKPSDIIDRVRGAMYRYGNKAEHPAWFTSALRSTFGSMAREYEARKRPVDLDNLKLAREQHEAKERHAFNQGAVTIPIAMAPLIKTYEDYKRHVPGYERWNLNENVYKADYFIPHVLLSYHLAKSSKFSRDDVGCAVRRYQPKPFVEQEEWQRREEGIDVSDMWVEIVTSADDTEIVEVRAGFTPVKTEAA